MVTFTSPQVKLSSWHLYPEISAQDLEHNPSVQLRTVLGRLETDPEVANLEISALFFRSLKHIGLYMGFLSLSYGI